MLFWRRIVGFDVVATSSGHSLLNASMRTPSPAASSTFCRVYLLVDEWQTEPRAAQRVLMSNMSSGARSFSAQFIPSFFKHMSANLPSPTRLACCDKYHYRILMHVMTSRRLPISTLAPAPWDRSLASGRYSFARGHGPRSLPASTCRLLADLYQTVSSLLTLLMAF